MNVSQSQQSPSAWGLLLLRLMVGWVFLSEGIQKFLLPAALGAGRFAKIGIPAPQLTGPFVGLVEIICGAMLIFGFATVLATIPLLIDIAVAIATTKLSALGKQGFWSTMHDGRTDASTRAETYRLSRLGFLAGRGAPEDAFGCCGCS